MWRVSHFEEDDEEEEDGGLVASKSVTSGFSVKTCGVSVAHTTLWRNSWLIRHPTVQVTCLILSYDCYTKYDILVFD